MTTAKNRYETIMILNVNTPAGEEGVKALISRFTTLIADNGAIESEEDWGKRRLAYPIQDEIDGYYYMVHFNSDPDFPAELDRVYKITDGVLRTLIIRVDEEEAKKEPAATVPAETVKEASVPAATAEEAPSASEPAEEASAPAAPIEEAPAATEAAPEVSAPAETAEPADA